MNMDLLIQLSHTLSFLAFWVFLASSKFTVVALMSINLFLLLVLEYVIIQSSALLE